MLNEENHIVDFLQHLRLLQGVFEVILVDGGSSDRTIEEVARNIHGFGHPIRLVKSSPGRAIQMNRGAEEATGDVFLFLHADCQIPKDAVNIIERKMSERKIIGGGFKQTFSTPDFFLRLLSAFGNFRTGLTKTFFGDSGIFLRKDTFREIGGYDEVSFLEDVGLCKKAKRWGELIQINRYVVTSPRRFVTEGKIRTALAFAIACTLNILGLRPGFLKKYFAKSADIRRNPN